MKVLKGERPSFKGTNVPDKMQDLLKRCWSQTPESRPSSEEIFSKLSPDFSYSYDPVNDIEVRCFLEINEEEDKNDESVESVLNDYIKNFGKEFRKVTDLNDLLHITCENCNVNLVKTILSKKKKKKKRKKKKKKKKKTIDVNLLRIKASADKGHRISIYYYAIMLYEGDGIEINKREASKYFKLAADEEHPRSIYYYAVMLRDGDGIEENKQEAIKYFKLGADKGDLDSMYNYAVMLRDGDGIEKNKQEAVKYFKFAADEGDLESMYCYAIMLYEGDGIEMDKQEASKYFNLAADKEKLESKKRSTRID